MVERTHGTGSPRTLNPIKMKTLNLKLNRRQWAFTLIELLVVIAIVAILAALIFPATGAIKKNAMRKRAAGDLQAVELAINNYKAQLGHFPPDNPDDTNTWINQLYYELLGSKFDNITYTPESGQGALQVAQLNAFFGGTKVGGFVNATKGGGEDSPVAKSYLTGLKPTQYLLVQQGGVQGMVLGTTVKGPVMLTDGGDKTINPFRYSISGPNRRNREGFDLWVDILIGGKTNRISNWSDTHEIVP